MATTSVPPPSVSAELPAKVSARARLIMLQTELEAESDARRKAVLQYEIAALTEHKLDDQNSAVKLYLDSYNINPLFRPPLVALMRIFESRRSSKNLDRIYSRNCARLPAREKERRLS